jgi:3',5'-cyclic AMP phosphodiesterase CpdA
MRLAHLSDLHPYPHGALRPADLLGRRVVGALNLFLMRTRSHSNDVARLAVAKALELGVDHVIVTGDVTNLALEPEFALAADVLAPLGGPDFLSMIPGNHDYYTPAAIAARRFEHWFGRFVWAAGEGDYPAWKDFPGVRLILACSATKPPPLCAHGWIGAPQADRIATLAREARDQGLFPVLAVHHYMHVQHSVREITGFLLDKGRLRDVVRTSGVGLVLHGHDHHPHEMTVPGADGCPVPVIGCGSTTLFAPDRGRRGRFNVYDIADGRVTVQRWQVADQGDRFEPLPG